MIRYIIVFLGIIPIISCNPKPEQASQPEEGQLQFKYANGFRVFQIRENIYRVFIDRPYQGSTNSLEYLLVPEGESIPDHDQDVTVIKTPVKRIICTSTTHIPLLDYLNETQALIGFPTPDYISSPAMRARIDSGLVEDLGIDKSLNVEMALELNPDAVMAYTMGGVSESILKLRELNIPVLINAEYLEEHPLGRAEWIRLAGLLFDKKDRSDSVFTAIEKRYIDLQKIAGQTDLRPSAFSGVMYGDTWFLPGGNNYAARLMKDAGIEYLWNDNPENGYLELSFETVLDRAVNADLWIGVASFTSLDQLGAEDSRYTLFSAFENGHVYTYDARKGALGGSEFLELGYLRPDIILADLIRIAHPEISGLDSMYFHAKLQ
ncbi:ABC transporter substrate-binding protein [Fulvivirga sedimenti]|uniref:ABC transporter substrate-binding protein n=1 Tax=Fulvivirga sedimenti TaxID=2879465 RepID=A0A9X1HLD5_9BACT|nr:ABC transporter substrate-binding protein [Fulvivirga sedimenti]MCA6074130.1 ABC transporter substrate-binding protein [Fulvivirga sedimenti]